jgi:hypothetical protein
MKILLIHLSDMHLKRNDNPIVNRKEFCSAPQLVKG